MKVNKKLGKNPHRAKKICYYKSGKVFKIPKKEEMPMKKLLIVILALALFLVMLVSCSTEQSNTDTQTDTAQSTESKVNMQTVTFDSNGGSEVQSCVVERNTGVARPENPTRTGYNFLGWYVGDEKWSFIDSVVTYDITLTAKWEPIVYTIEYIGAIGGKTTYTAEDEFELTGTSQTGQEFVGWYLSESYAQEVKKIEKGTTGNLVLYAKLKLPTYDFEVVVNSTGGVTIVRYISKHSDVVVPTKVAISGGQRTVNKIAPFAFYGCDYITSIELPSTIEEIGEGAFMNCTSLENVTIGVNNTHYPENNEEIEDLPEILEKEEGVPDIYEPVTNDAPESIGVVLFTAIKDRAFYGCTSLKQVNGMEGVYEIGEYAFSYCTSLEYLIIQVGTEVNGYAFRNNSNLELYVMGSKENTPINFTGLIVWEYVGIKGQTDDFAWVKTKNGIVITMYLGANEEMVVPSTIEETAVVGIASCAIINRTDIKKVTLPNTIKEIGSRAFYGCSSLNRIDINVINSELEIIGDYAFYNTALRQVFLPASIKSVGKQAFYGCTELTIYVEVYDEELFSTWEQTWNKLAYNSYAQIVINEPDHIG